MSTLLRQFPAPAVELLGSYTPVQDWPEKCGLVEVASISKVNELLVTRNKCPISPKVGLSGGFPPVGTTVPVPAIRVRVRVFDTGSVPSAALLEVIVVVLVYVIELAAVLELR